MSYLLPQKVVLATTGLAAILAVYWSGFIQGGNSRWNIFKPGPSTFECIPQFYTTEIVSINPLVIYINNFTSPTESTSLIEAGASSLQTSEVYLNGIKRPSLDRTSKSAGLSPSAPAVQCILSRARSFLGTLLLPTDDFGVPQLVRYEKGEHFDLHHDWYETPQMMKDGSGRRFNRIASFFVYLEEERVSGGETWFPYLENGGGGDRGVENGKWGGHEDGGVAFRTLSGNAVFWINLHGNGTGDERVMHAGLPLDRGRKTAMNIWPRRFY